MIVEPFVYRPRDSDIRNASRRFASPRRVPSGAARYSGHRLNRESRLSTPKPKMTALATTTNNRPSRITAIIACTPSAAYGAAHGRDDVHGVDDANDSSRPVIMGAAQRRWPGCRLGCSSELSLLRLVTPVRRSVPDKVVDRAWPHRAGYVCSRTGR